MTEAACSLQKLQLGTSFLWAEPPARALHCSPGMATLKELIVWQLAEELRAEVVRLANSSAARRDFKFRDQIVPAAASVAANIAEGYGRTGHRDFARFIGIAVGSLRETETWLRDGLNRNFWSAEEAETALRLCKRLTVGLSRLRAYLRSTPTPN